MNNNSISIEIVFAVFERMRAGSSDDEEERDPKRPRFRLSHGRGHFLFAGWCPFHKSSSVREKKTNKTE